MEETKNSSRKRLVIVAFVALVIGFCLFFLARVIFAKSHQTHYHANFGLFINGQRDEFKNFAFYEEVQACSADNSNNPRQRVHMHNQENDAVHVHDNAVMWGNFFENLDYGLTDNALITKNGVYEDGKDGKELTFLLNGQEVEAIANRVIKNEDRLLVSYGDPSNVQTEYGQITSSAAEHNHKPDPAACSGSGEIKFGDRIKQVLDFTR